MVDLCRTSACAPSTVLALPFRVRMGLEGTYIHESTVPAAPLSSGGQRTVHSERMLCPESVFEPAFMIALLNRIMGTAVLVVSSILLLPVLLIRLHS